MRKHNIGRISIIVIALNVIFALVYFADKNDVSLQNEALSTNEAAELTQTKMVIYMDETVDGKYVTMLENIISDRKYDESKLTVVKSYDWYLTDNIRTAGENMYCINEGEVAIYAADDKFADYVDSILTNILTD